MLARPITPTGLKESRPQCEVLIVGGGPVGLLLANLLGARSVRTIVVEKRSEPAPQSMAIGITPPSLEILRRLGLDQSFARAGLPITQAFVHEQGDLIGRLSFSDIPSRYRFILSLPQSKTAELLRANLDRFRSVTCHPGLPFTALRQQPGGIVADLCPTAAGQPSQVAARYLVGCDGHRSPVRQAAGLPTTEKPYPQRYLMADFDALPELDQEAHLFFTAHGSVESFPLPGHRRRWIVLVPGPQPDDPGSFLVNQVRSLVGYDLGGLRRHGLSPFTTKRMLVQRYYRGAVLLCGDAAHVMSSIGGQGMNTGFADAAFLAGILPEVLRQPQTARQWFPLYDRVRRKAFQVAASRAARGMWLGTRQGNLASGLRKWIIRDFLLAPWMMRAVASYFAMLTIPFNHYPAALLDHERAGAAPAASPCHSD